MWAPADLFNPATNAIVLAVKRVASYFAEHLLVLALVIVVVAAIVGWAGSRKAPRRDPAD